MRWGVIRDDELFEAHPTRAKARIAARGYRSGSKHRWRVSKIIIEAWHEDKNE
jgi:hypothetical protein